MPSRHAIETSSLVATEKEILDLSDAGEKPAAIAQRLGKDVACVRAIISRYAVTACNPHENMVRRGSAALLAAIRRHHPECCGGAA